MGNVLRNRKGQITGQIKSDGWYEQSLSKTVHAMRMDSSLGIDSEHLEKLLVMDVVGVRKVFRDTGETYEAHLEKFKEFGFEKQWSVEDGKQTFLADKHWSYKNAEQPRLFA
jgi:hypothetical protein